jgi:hypothetical protein
VKGEIEILRYVLEHHPEASRHERVIRDSILRRHVAAGELAFFLGDLVQVREFLDAVPSEARSGSVRLKRLIAALPSVAAEPCRRASLSLAALLRRLR